MNRHDFCLKRCIQILSTNHFVHAFCAKKHPDYVYRVIRMLDAP